MSILMRHTCWWWVSWSLTNQGRSHVHTKLVLPLDRSLSRRGRLAVAASFPHLVRSGGVLSKEKQDQVRSRPLARRSQYCHWEIFDFWKPKKAQQSKGKKSKRINVWMDTFSNVCIPLSVKPIVRLNTLNRKAQVGQPSDKYSLDSLATMAKLFDRISVQDTRVWPKENQIWINLVSVLMCN